MNVFSLRVVYNLRTQHNFSNFQKETKRCLFSFLKPRNIAYFSTRDIGRFGIKKLLPINGNSRKLCARPVQSLRFPPSRQFRTKNSQTEPVKEAKKKSEAPKQERQEKRDNQKQDNNGSLAGAATKIGIYATSFTALMFGGCAIWQYENEKKIFRDRSVTWREYPSARINKHGDIRKQLNEMWNNMSAVEKLTKALIVINCAVWILWKVSSPQFMSKFFTLTQKGNSLSMILCTFSHNSALHLYVNMFVLSSFSMAWIQLSRRNPASSLSGINGHERYLAFFLSAGMFSSSLSLLIKLAGRIPQGSLGASGAILGLVGYTCEKLPNNLLSIVFIPNWTFTSGSAQKFILGFDIVGLLVGMASGWKYMIFDHAGHLGGMLFGIWYARHGEKLLHRWSLYVARRWHGSNKG